MRILIHTDQYFPATKACAYRYQVFAEEFIKAGHDVTVICSNSNKKSNFEMPEREERIIYTSVVQVRKKTVLTRLLNNVSFLVSTILSAHAAGKVDVVITSIPTPVAAFAGWVIAKAKKAKFVLDVRDIWPDVAVEMGMFTSQSIYYKIFRFLTDFVLKRADLITVVTPGKQKKIEYRIKQMFQKNTNVLYVSNGLDEHIFDSPLYPDVIQKYHLNHESCVYIGNVGLAQGLEMMLQLASNVKYSDMQFLIFGTGAEEQALKQQAKEQKIENIRFCGPLPHEHVYTVLRCSKLCFIPLKSAKMEDSVPTKLYEAIGVGCPVLLAAFGDACKILEETGFGRCAEPQNLVELKRAMDEILMNYEDILLRREASRELMINKYSRQAIARRFEKQLNSYMESKLNVIT